VVAAVPRVTLEATGRVLIMTLNRTDKRNAFDLQMLSDLADAYTTLETDSGLRCGVLLANGPHFTAGLDLGDVVPAIQMSKPLFRPDQVNPWQTTGRRRTKPIVVGAQGKCLTLGIELLLAAEVRVVEETCTFAQLEVSRGIFPFGGGTARFVQTSGWGNAMRWMLTAEEMNAQEALRIGLVQELVPEGQLRSRCTVLAHLISAQAPLAVQATLRSASVAIDNGSEACYDQLDQEIRELLGSEDARIGFDSFLHRQPPTFVGH
jgi:enoyl-CoA hydratase/carnithine racemase